MTSIFKSKENKEIVCTISVYISHIYLYNIPLLDSMELNQRRPLDEEYAEN